MDTMLFFCWFFRTNSRSAVGEAPRTRRNASHTISHESQFAMLPPLSLTIRYLDGPRGRYAGHRLPLDRHSIVISQGHPQLVDVAAVLRIVFSGIEGGVPELDPGLATDPGYDVVDTL